MDSGLGDSHRRVVGSGMLIVDSAAVRILDLVFGRNSPSAVTSLEGSVTNEEKQEIRTKLLRLQELIALLVEKYDLGPSKKNLRRILASEASQIWVCLEDCRPTRIKGYGSMPESTADALEADLQAMLRISHRLLALFNS